MPEPAPSPELLRDLGRLLRGLSALFWGLPVSLVTCVHVALKNRLEAQTSDFILPIIVNGVLLYGTWQIGYFHRQERIWLASVDRVRMLAMVLTGLSPFLFWHTEVPDANVFYLATLLLAAFGLLFLYYLNHVMLRLAMMLPDQGLQQETRLFTQLNQYLLVAIPFSLSLLSMVVALVQSGQLPSHWMRVLQQPQSANQWFFLLLTLLPVATTMAILWKIKEVVFQSIFGSKS
ncbi:MAG: hypothetical protein WCO56_07880 [Verrucomicrobiota bacterium]